jgi:hypothetical protein
MAETIFTVAATLSCAFYLAANAAALRSLRLQRSPVVLSKR